MLTTPIPSLLFLGKFGDFPNFSTLTFMTEGEEGKKNKQTEGIRGGLSTDGQGGSVLAGAAEHFCRVQWDSDH